MRLVVVPPLFDLTLTPVIEADDRLIDLNAHFVHRLTAPDALRQLAERVPADEAVFVHAAAAALGRERAGFGTLRAAGLALRFAAANDPSLRLAGDDVELVDGSTESSTQVVAAAARTRLFDPEIALAATAGQVIHLVLETDQQLPAVVGIVAAVGAGNVVLCGRFATEHRAALGAVEALRGVRFDEWAPRWRLADDWAPRPIRWVKRPGDWTPGEEWVGWLAPRDVLAVPAEAWASCVGLTVTAAQVHGDDFVDVHGDTVDLSGFTPSIELLVGAPGVSAEETRETAIRLVESGRLAGLSPFRLPAGAPPVWAGTALDLLDVSGHDLPRWSRFAVAEAPLAELNAELASRADYPGRFAAEATPLAELNAELASRTDLYPGRFAACCLSRPDEPGDWDPSAVVVDSSVVNLRTGRAFRVHPKLAPVLERLANGDAHALTRLPEAGRVKLADQLVRSGALRRSA
ncbi:hypothetical protein ACIA8G_12515 [Lentzea sp. NPDC051213]|uniref:hypothetical protein n=1 Tax=Lentzea sp. NPDC051213 TaxID=3364126 RepID=UPI00378F1F68